MAPSSRKPKNMNIQDYSDKDWVNIQDKIAAFERFVNLNALVLGILQILSLSMPSTIWQSFSGWFRTLPSSGYPSEQIVRLTLQQSAPSILAESPPSLLLTKFLQAKESFRHQAIHRRTG
ncbi:hypothetical protein [Oscillatoria sp. HE19RPO]|uniref:hypothetical protein n=1 Tax=Oscillatoria sp. HE19RPO TaxID=2954806 RepID=UPI0020C51629|nr:hypothetical protein [Oscillatoria sp. HE19RPO]